jgi:site-specific recombinase XerC
MSGQPFSIFRRGKFFYVQFKDKNDQFGTAISSRKTTKREAINWAVEKLRSGYIAIRDKILFNTYCHDFFDDNGRYATNKRNAGKRISDQHLKERRGLLANHILPYFEGLFIQDIQYRHLEEFRNKLFEDGYAGQTVVKALQTVNCILKDAGKYEVVNSLPVIPECSTHVVSPRGCFSVDEIRRMFSLQNWIDQRVFAICLLAASTGLRLGEIQALVISDLHLDERYLVCRRSYDHRLRQVNSTTKNGKVRHIVLSSTVIRVIQNLITSHTYASDDDFVFWADIVDTKPLERNTIIRGFKAALTSIGINESERRKRNLVFHSFRHFCNSFYVNSRLPLHHVQNQLGHLSHEMTERYYHPNIEDMGGVRQAQEGMFSGISALSY